MNLKNTSDYRQEKNNNIIENNRMNKVKPEGKLINNTRNTRLGNPKTITLVIAINNFPKIIKLVNAVLP